MTRITIAKGIMVMILTIAMMIVTEVVILMKKIVIAIIAITRME